MLCHQSVGVISILIYSMVSSKEILRSITVNEEEAEVVRMVYDMYLESYGTTTIAKRLVELGIKNE